MIYVVTGKLGSGKSLVAVGKIRDYLNQGRMVATNLDLYLEYLINPFSKNARVYRVPDKPTADDLHALPTPYEGEYDENKTGLLVLDELGTWFNSRAWNDKSRAPVIDWFLHARKLGWDIIFIVQNVNMMDSQAREGLAEMVVHCVRLDRFVFPFLGTLFKLAGIELKPPKIHLGNVKYGASPTSPHIERWTYTGTDLYDAYDTKQVFRADNNGLAQYLPPNHFYGRYTDARTHSANRFNRSTNRFLKTLSTRGAFFLGLTLAAVGLSLWPSADVVPKVQAESLKAESKIEVVKPHSDLEGVHITASVKSSKGFDYVFQRGDEAVYPEYLGYKVRYISPCRASLFNDTGKITLTCSPYSSASNQVQGLYAPEPERAELQVDSVISDLL